MASTSHEDNHPLTNKELEEEVVHLQTIDSKYDNRGDMFSEDAQCVLCCINQGS